MSLEGLILVYCMYCNDRNVLQEQESSKREKKKPNVAGGILIPWQLWCLLSYLIHFLRSGYSALSLLHFLLP